MLSKLLRNYKIYLGGLTMLKRFIRRISMLSVFVVMFVMIGCASHHVPNSGAIEFSDFPKVDNKQHLNIINDQANSEEISIGNFGAGKLVGDLKTWTGSAVEITQKSLEKEGVIISENASKILKLAVTDAKVTTAGVPMVAALARCQRLLKTETGDGYSKVYEGTNKALNPPWACDAAMKSVISALLNDKTILAYLSK